jgi:hypothetical protein
MTPKTAEVLAALRAHVENDNGNGFGQVYLDNACPRGMSARSFAGHLSALERVGLYKSQGDDCFGDVKIEN